MALWPSKKNPNEDHVEIGGPGAPAAAGDNDTDPLGQLLGQLDDLRQQLDQANRQVVAYLTHRESQATAAEGGAAGGAAERIDALAEKIDRLADGNSRQLAALAEGLRDLQQRLGTGWQNLLEQLRPEQPEGPDAKPASGSDWQRAILGSELAEQPGLDTQREDLLRGVLEGDPGACSLVGQLLVFRSALSDRMPPLLKDIGEALYRWRPKTRPDADKIEQALVGWLTETMQEAGIANTIELVHPGERFDSARHTASTRGVEITEVHGWIVLRDNGKVYTKAAVAVK